MNDRLSPIEALMWKVGHDARLRMTVGTLLVARSGPATAARVERLEQADGPTPRCCGSGPRMHPASAAGRAGSDEDPRR